MPIVVVTPAPAPSTPQFPTTVVVFDYEQNADGTPLVNGTVVVWLGQDRATLASPAVVLDSKRVSVVTDANGYWQLSLIPNVVITPAGTYYVVRTPSRTYRFTIPGGVGPFQASANPAP